MNDYIKVAALDNVFEAQRLEAILHDMQIPHLIENYHDTAYNGLFQSYRGWGCIKAPAQYKEQIEQILAEIRDS